MKGNTLVESNQRPKGLYLSLPIQALDIIRIGQRLIDSLWLNAISGHGAIGLVSQLGSTKTHYKCPPSQASTRPEMTLDVTRV